MSNIEPVQHGNVIPASRVAEARITGAAQIEDDEIDLIELFRTVWRGKWWIAVCMLATILIAGYWAFLVAVPKFATTAYVTMENRQSQVVDFENVISGLSGDQTSINTEVEVLKSRELAKKLVLELDLVNDPEFNADLREEGWLSPGNMLNQLREMIAPADPAVAGAP